MNALDRLARAVAEPAAGEDTTRVTRRDLARRGGLAVLSFVALGQLGLPRLATAAPPPCPSLAECLERSRQAAATAYYACLDKKGPGVPYDEFRNLDCRLWDAHNAARDVQKRCFADCKRSKAPPRKPPSRPSRTKRQAPPPLPPNPYGAVTDECATCRSVGGECCFGGPGLTTSGGLCICATAGVRCDTYGC